MTNFKFTPSQSEGFQEFEKFLNAPVSNNFYERVFVITGQAGTGKTTFLKYALQALTSKDLENGINYDEDDFFSDISFNVPNVMGVTVSHKAKLRLQESIPNASTYAGYFGLKPDYMNDGEMKFVKKPKTPFSKPDLCELPFLVVVHDEVSMYGMQQIHQLEAETNSSCKIVLVGDKNQLPPIEDGVQKKTDIDSPVFVLFKNKIELKERVRQTIGNPILDLADEIRKEIWGERDLMRILKLIHKENKFKDGVGYRTIKPAELVNDFTSAYKKDNDTRIISYRNNRVTKLNEGIRKRLYPNVNNKFTNGEALYMTNTFTNHNDKSFYNSEEITINSISEFIKDGVKCYRAICGNDAYDSIDLIHEDGLKAYNLKLNDLKDDALSKSGKARKEAWARYHDFVNKFAQVAYGYVFTAYKAQGSGYKSVYVDTSDILSIPVSNKRKLQALYTAVTRATHEVVFF